MSRTASSVEGLVSDDIVDDESADDVSSFLEVCWLLMPEEGEVGAFNSGDFVDESAKYLESIITIKIKGLKATSLFLSNLIHQDL